MLLPTNLVLEGIGISFSLVPTNIVVEKIGISYSLVPRKQQRGLVSSIGWYLQNKRGDWYLL